MAHLADQWLLQSTDALKNPFSKDIYQKLLKEGEQFLWAGFDMDPVSSKPFSYMKFFSDYVHMIRLCMNVYFNHMQVRTMAKKLVDVQRWAEGVRSCLAKIENHSLGSTNALERADLEYVTELLSFDTMPCNEPGHLKLKVLKKIVKLWHLIYLHSV